MQRESRFDTLVGFAFRKLAELACFHSQTKDLSALGTLPSDWIVGHEQIGDKLPHRGRESHVAGVARSLTNSDNNKTLQIVTHVNMK